MTERPDGGTDITFPDGDQELDLGSAAGHLQLMAKLAEGRFLCGVKNVGLSFTLGVRT